NNRIGERVARECLRRLLNGGGTSPPVTVLGVTFKENVPHIRNSKVGDIIREFRSFGVSGQGHDPHADAGEAGPAYGIAITAQGALKRSDAVVLAVAHDAYIKAGWPLIESLLKDGRGLVMDIKAKLDRARAPAGIELWRL